MRKTHCYLASFQLYYSRVIKSTSSGAYKDCNGPGSGNEGMGSPSWVHLGTGETGTAQGCIREAEALMAKGLEKQNIRRMQGLVLPCSTGCCGATRPPCSRSTSGMECHHAQALVTCNLEEVLGLASLMHLHCNNEAKDLMDAGSKCIDEHINHISSMIKKIKGSSLSLSLIHWEMRIFACGHQAWE